ncbi:MAG: hypothetical protein E7179_06320 [Erysipelotrichaceae bacterium]|nr:hypothetical protein [Erysipelotrichaceae bacterium]
MGKVACWFLGMLTGAIVITGAEALTLAVMPSKTYLNGFGTQVVTDKIGNKGVIDIYNHMNEFVVDDVPAIKKMLDDFLASGGMGDLIAIDYEKIRNVKLVELNQASQILKNAITITATIKSMNVDTGKFGSLKIFSEWTPWAPTAEEIAEAPQLYYFKDSSGKYVRAFDNSGNRVAECPADAQLYRASLSEVPVDQLFKCLTPRLNECTYKEFAINLMGGDESKLKDNIIYKLIGDKYLKDLNDVKAEEFKLIDVLPKTTENQKMYDLLTDVTGKAEEELTVGDLKKVNMDDAHVVKFIPYSGNEQLYDVLIDMTGKTGSGSKQELASSITLGELDGASMDGVKLTSIVSKTGDNAKMYDLLEDLTGKDSAAIVLNDLKTINTDNAHLTSVIEKSASNEKMFNLLEDLTGKGSDDVVLGDLKTINMDDAHLSTLIPITGNEKLYNVLCDLSGNADPEDVTLGSVSGGNIDNVKLSSLLGSTSSDNAVLNALLKDDSVTMGNFASKIDALKINQIFGEEVFIPGTSASPRARSDKYELNATTGVYTYNAALPDDGENTYYISATAGVWLLMAYNASNIVPTIGRADTFTPSPVTFSTLTHNPDTVSTSIGNATIYQLESAKVISTSSLPDKSITLSEALGAL